MNAEAYVGENTDSVLGQEFLTWLWFCSESRPGSFTDAKGRPFSVVLNQRVVVQGGDGDTRETTSVSGGATDGAHLPLREARLGLMTGKKVTRALLSLEQDGLSWQMVSKADDFSINAYKTPKLASDDDEDPDALFMEKMFVIEQGLALFDVLYKAFLEVRIVPAAWAQETREIGVWMARQE